MRHGHESGKPARACSPRTPGSSLQAGFNAAWLLVLIAPPVASTPICKWVDDAGRTHLSEVVPERYEKAATCTDSRQYELTPAQRRAAEERARSVRAAAQLQARPASSASQPAASASQPVRKRPLEVVTESTTCPTWWRLYEESLECFGRFRTTRGATKPEGFAHCNVVPSPEPKCGPRVN